MEPRARSSWCELSSVKWHCVGGTSGERHACASKLLDWPVVAVVDFETRL